MKKAAAFILFSLCACSDPLNMPSDSRAKDTYYKSEIIPLNFHDFYGIWKLVSVTGGFSGRGFDPDFDYLEMKPFGLYSIVKDDMPIENGKVELDIFDLKSQLLQVKFLTDSAKNGSLLGSFSSRYVDFEKGKMTLRSPCCDAFDHHFERVR